MNQTKETNDKTAQNAPPPAALATVPQNTGPLATMGQGAGFAVLDNVRLEPKSFNEALVCAELAAKIQLGNVESPADALARIMRGATLGVDAMTSIESIFLINKRTFIEARLLHAVILRSPLCAKCKILEDESSADVGVVLAQRVGEPEQKFKFTMPEAIAVIGGPEEFKKKDNYRKDPKGMLIARALERACNRTWPDVTKGFLTTVSVHDRDVLEHNATTGITVVTQAGALPGTPARDFEVELASITKALDEAESDAQFKTERKNIEDWTAPEAFKKRAQAHYNEARSTWKSDGLSKIARDAKAEKSGATS